MHVQRWLEFLQARSHRTEEVVRRDAVLLHDFGRKGVLLDNRRGGLLLRGVIRDGRGAGPNELGPGLLQSHHNLFEALHIIGRRRSPIMDAEIEMDNVPLPFAEPHVEVLQARSGGTAISGGAMDVRLTRKGLARRLSVPTRNGIADEQDAR